MKKLLISLATILALTSSSAQADNNDWVAPLLGGMLLGSMIGSTHHQRHYVYQPQYQPRVQQQCYNRWVQVWDDYRGQWIMVQRTECQWVQY
jgi:hypothetical protein